MESTIDVVKRKNDENLDEKNDSEVVDDDDVDETDASFPLNDSESSNVSRVDKRKKWLTLLSSIVGIMMMIGVLTGFIDVETLEKVSSCADALGLQDNASSIDLNISSLVSF
jgi:hypothetical protein